MSLARVHNFSISLDGFGTGEPQTLDAPFGHAGERLHEWLFLDQVVARDRRPARRHPRHRRRFRAAARPRGRRRDHGCAEVRPAGTAPGPGVGRDGGVPNPPFHTPVFVLTNHPRPSIEMEGGTTFYFVDASPAEALETAREAADGQDVRLGGGATVIRDFVAAGLVDHMHIVVVPIRSAEAYASGTDWRALRRTTRSSPPRRPA